MEICINQLGTVKVRIKNGNNIELKMFQVLRVNVKVTFAIENHQTWDIDVGRQIINIQQKLKEMLNNNTVAYKQN